MSREQPPRHLLDGFPESALHFVRAMESNRRRVAAEFGISEIEIRALFRVAEAGSATPKELAAELLVTTGAITGVADRLVGAGLVHRTAHPGDRRSLFLELTEAGHAEMARMHVDFISMLTSASEGIDAHQLESASVVLKQLTDNLIERPE